MNDSQTQRGLETRRLEYHLPPERIATRPAEPRDSARMMVVSRSSDQVVHRNVRDLPALLAAGDVIVVNNTAVVPARIVGRREDSGGHVEGLFLKDLGGDRWLVMLKSNGRLRPGVRVCLVDWRDQATGVSIELLEMLDSRWIVKRGEGEGDASVDLHRVGRTPLPPYILRARREAHAAYDDSSDRAWYQTVYADQANQGSVAAPTAGLHFTPALLEALLARGVERLDVTLHVGPGTFAPITADTLDQHAMHTEQFEVPAATVRWLAARERGAMPDGRLIAIGTTAVRTLESLPTHLDPATIEALRGKTSLLISPPYQFRRVQGMLTNFHLPRSTLLALVAAMLGLDRVLGLYETAVREGYRFYSYGDAMLILP